MGTRHDKKSGHSLYQCWRDMIGRCASPSHHAWANYGGRGIAVCSRWVNSFDAFVEDMGEKPTPSHSLDRVDNEAGYSPENCRWATRKQQNNNRRPIGVRLIGDAGVRFPVSFRLSGSERAEVESAAAESDETFSNFVRRVLVTAAAGPKVMVGDAGIEPATLPV